jgi:phosphatidyl-myo-inositol dimannoside synthase
VALGRVKPLTGRAGLAAVSFAGAGGGLAYVARLIRHTLAGWQTDPVWSVALEPARYGTVSLGERCRFSARVLGAQVTGRIDWLAFNHVGIAQVQRLLPRGARRPYLVFVHDVEAWAPDLAPSRLATLQGASLRVANSRYTADRVTRAHPTIGPIVPCSLGLLDDDAEGALPARPPAGLETTSGDGLQADSIDRVGPLSVMIVGRLQASERYKGHDELLECWPQVVTRVPTAQLVVVGLGDDCDRLQEKARALGVASHVLFCGFVPAPVLSTLWQRIAVFAMPSAREGFGLVYLEAMRAGRPCIGSISDAAGDIIVDHETGLLVDRANRTALAEALVTLLTNGSMRRAMGEAGQHRFLAEFTAERFAARLHDAIDHAVQSGSSVS